MQAARSPRAPDRKGLGAASPAEAAEAAGAPSTSPRGRPTAQHVPLLAAAPLLQFPVAGGQLGGLGSAVARRSAVDLGII